MILAPNPSPRRQTLYHDSRQAQLWKSPIPTPIHYPLSGDLSHAYAFGADPILYDFQVQQYGASAHPPSQQSLMQPDPSTINWLNGDNLTPLSAATRGHKRESSLSSLGSGSAGPASPYSANTSSPLVVGHDIYNEYSDAALPLIKSLTPAQAPLPDQFYPQQFSGYNFANSNPFAFPMAHGTMQKPADGGEQEGYGSRLSAGQASRVPRDDIRQSGMLPKMDTWMDEYLQGFLPTAPLPQFKLERTASDSKKPPTLDRTVSDIEAAQSDSLYNPNLDVYSNKRISHIAPQPRPNDVINQRLQAANSQHLMATSQPPMTVSTRDHSPFRQNSPLAPAMQYDEPAQATSLQTARQVREQQNMEFNARVLQQQIAHASAAQGQNAAETISPKDINTNLVYNEREEDANNPLFPTSTSPMRGQQQVRPSPPSLVQQFSESGDDGYASMATTRRGSSSAYSSSSAQQQQGNYNFGAPAMPSNRQMPNAYPFVARQHTQTPEFNRDFPSTLTPMGSSSSDYMPDNSVTRPSTTTADGGTYTCTYHGCTRRFETPAKLQQHKREDHRNSALRDAGMTSTASASGPSRVQTQSGPHRCDRINPSTNKPCNTVFSRPYDLTRHEDTIHNQKRQKLKCEHCDEEKTFSRADALTRHYRVVHPHLIDEVTNKRRK